MNSTTPPEDAPAPRPRWTGIVGGAVVMLVLSAICAFMLQSSARVEDDTFGHLVELTSPFDVLVIFVLMSFVWLLIGRFWWSVGIVTAALAILAVASKQKLMIRQEPVFPSDMEFVGQAGFLLSMVTGQMIAAVVIGLVVLVLVIVVIGKLMSRWFPRPRLRRAEGGVHKRYLGLRILGVIVTGALLIHTVSFNSESNMWRALYDTNGEDWGNSSQLYNYRVHGFVGGFLYNMPTDPMDEPEGYDEAAMSDLAERYEGRAEQINADRDGSLEDTNVVVILSESFSDPTRMDGVELDEDPIPQTRETMEETLSGTMYSNSYGGGTSTMEFESMTGEPVGLFRQQANSPYQNFVSDLDGYPSAAGAFEEMGHVSVAIHPYNLHMYKRPAVYENFGFDRVINEDNIQEEDHLGRSPYISDASAFDEVLHQMDTTDEPVFTNLVTMQNHGPYFDFYDDPIGVEVADGSDTGQLSQYARGLHNTDDAMAEFLQQLREGDEKTIVVFYGDHLPGVYSDELRAQNDPETSLQTPYYVWNSETDQTSEGTVTTPAMFLPKIYEVADAPVTPYLALLDDVNGSMPVIQRERMLDPQGEQLDPENLDETRADLLQDLKLVQYDFSIGERYVVDEMWPGAVQRQ
ncbi:LTA synthase family protein [Kocuria palustris]|uniref:LTA synthase family protein n=1 Tax=Kocuria palustris TaxID=71999 RepID=UPI0020441AA2|nr:LTA synthase family protein [Kocuria palustris]MCM3330912.1 LTA synthase family protein [Kocuria palustris]